MLRENIKFISVRSFAFLITCLFALSLWNLLSLFQVLIKVFKQSWKTDISVVLDMMNYARARDAADDNEGILLDLTTQ